MKKKVVIFIDVVSHKNKLQIDTIINNGLIPHVFVSTYKDASDSYFNKGGSQTLLHRNIFKRLNHVKKFLKTNKNNIHHIEVYPADRSTFLYVFFSKFYKLKCICVERGDLLLFHKKGYDKLIGLSMWLCYKFSDIIWYKELFMKPYLEKINKRLYFLHNAIKVNDNIDIPPLSKREITFLWLNRIMPHRKSEWFIETLKHPVFKQTLNYLVGIIPNSLYKKEQEHVFNNKPDNLLLKEYSNNPEEFYKAARFFVFPAEVVFANHALLEAMSYGVVPLVSDQPGTDLIVENGKNGFIYKHTKKDFEETLLKAFYVSDEEYHNLSMAAIEKIKKEFSEEKYSREIKQLYDLVMKN